MVYSQKVQEDSTKKLILLAKVLNVKKHQDTADRKIPYFIQWSTNYLLQSWTSIATLGKLSKFQLKMVSL